MHDVHETIRVGRNAGRTPTLLSSEQSLKRESVPPSYKCCNKHIWRKTRRFARAIVSVHSLVYEQIEEQITYKPGNIIIKSKSAADLEKFLPYKAYTDVYAFRNAELVADIRLASKSDDV
ncbi:MAG: hypothetical protein QXM92_01755 [Candidatus Anstonellales archaeon]